MWCCLPHRCLRRTCSQPFPVLSFSTRCCFPCIGSFDASLFHLKTLRWRLCPWSSRTRSSWATSLVSWGTPRPRKTGERSWWVKKQSFFISSATYFFVQVLFLKEFCQFSQTLQPQSRESFYKTLSNLGVLPGEPITLLKSMIVGTENVEYL